MVCKGPDDSHLAKSLKNLNFGCREEPVLGLIGWEILITI